MASQARAVPTPARSSLSARLGLMAACPCRTRESVTRDIPSLRLLVSRKPPLDQLTLDRALLASLAFDN